MQKQRYRARDKTAIKMSREGLMEENLHDHTAVRAGRKHSEQMILPRRADDSLDLTRANGRPDDRVKKEKGRFRHKGIMENDDSAELEEPVLLEKGDDSGRDSRQRKKLYGIREEDGELSGQDGEDALLDMDDGDMPEKNTRPARMQAFRRRPSAARNYGAAAVETRHSRQKRQVQKLARAEKEKRELEKEQTDGERKETSRFRQTQETGEQSLDSFREEIGARAKRERLNQEQRKKARLVFDADDETVRTTGTVKKAGSAAAGAASIYLHGKAHEAEQENAALEGSHKAELLSESALRSALHKSDRGLRGRNPRLLETSTGTPEMGRVQFESVQETEKTAGRKAAQEARAKENAVKRFWQKRCYKKAYLAAKEGRQEAKEAVHISQTVFVKAKRAAAAVAGRNKGIFGVVAVMVVLFALMAMSLSSCGALMQGATSSIAGTTYPSTDDDIYAVENAYAALEDALNRQINGMESSSPGHDEYRYQVDEITHNPYHLISYFTAKYGEFTYEQVKDEVEEIFRQQYGLSTHESSGVVTETKTVRVGESLGQVVTSGYCSCPICCGVWSGGPTASGVYPTANHTIAVDASNPFVPMGTKVVMNGVEYVVEDTGGFAQYGVQFDVYYDDHATAAAHGHQTWDAYIADDNGAQEVEVTSTRQVDRLDVTLTNHGLDAVLRSRMDENEEKRYDLYNTTYGHRDYLFDLNTLPSGGPGGFGYQIPAEALSDRRFANMIREAEKYLGYPYVWGGSSPSTSFDCSGFVSWVINNCGNGWNVGRATADGLRGYCAYVSPSQAKPGDLIFFQGTYNTPGASHVGIYVGNNMMIHCGNPIQYTSIASAYWQQHFMAFGRIQ